MTKFEKLDIKEVLKLKGMVFFKFIEQRAAQYFQLCNGKK